VLLTLSIINDEGELLAVIMSPGGLLIIGLQTPQAPSAWAIAAQICV
jgi:hypothetical protein